MRNLMVAAACAAVVMAGLSSPATAATKASPGTIVIVFKDGHRQSFSLADVERIEFAGATSGVSSVPSAEMPPRGRFFGKWEAGDGAGSTFTITLNEDGTALRSIGHVHGHWRYVNGEAQITWDDGLKDALRRVGNRYEKSAYGKDKSFTDEPDNVAEAHNTAQRPI